MSVNRLVDGFLRALEIGTIQQYGSDPAELRWEPITPQMLNHACIYLRAFLQKLPDHVGDNSLSVSRFANETRRGFDMNRSMLFHIAQRKRERTGGSGTVTSTRTAEALPASLLPALIWEGCKRDIEGITVPCTRACSRGQDTPQRFLLLRDSRADLGISTHLNPMPKKSRTAS